MKKSLILLSGVVILSLCSCNVNNQEDDDSQSDSDTVDSIVEREINGYALTATLKDKNKSEEDATEDDYTVSREQGCVFRAYTINNESVPYVSFSDFVNEYLDVTDEDETSVKYKYSFDGSVVKVVNPVNNASMTFDVNSKIVTYKLENVFGILDESFSNEFSGAVFDCPFWDDSSVTYEYHEATKSYSFDLNSYSINDYINNGEVYLPYNTLCVLFNNSLTGEWTYAGDAFYNYTASQDYSSLAMSKYICSFGTDWITKDYLLDSYNNLALNLDMHFGLDQRPSRVSKGKTITYLAEGAYAALAPYKEKLLSTDANVSNHAFSEFFSTELDDGGHTSYDCANILCEYIDEDLKSGPEDYYCGKPESGIVSARSKYGTGISDVLPDAESANGYYKEYNNDTAYIQFNEFAMSKETVEDYVKMNINQDNYYYDSVSLFNYANTKIHNNKNIKNVVIDLSANGGGDVLAEEYIASWVCGGFDGIIRDSKINDMLNYHVAADVNFDGNVDENDYLPSDINVYVMISGGSFSCGNALSCTIKDNRKENTYFIGSWTGGGSCDVGSTSMSFLGGSYKYSSANQSGRQGSSQDNFISEDVGVEADYLKIDDSDYDAFADINSILTKIRA